MKAATILILLVTLWAVPLLVKADDPRFHTSDITPRSMNAVARGLAWLADQQQDDGSWTCKVGYKLNEDFIGEEGKHVGVTALAGMAYLANGNTPGRGKYGHVVEGALSYVLSCVRTNDGYISANGTRMYEHAFATMFLAEVYGMSPRDDLKEKLRQAAYLIVRSQNDEGGWRYQPFARDADISITVSTLQALRAARNVGIRVPKEVIKHAMDYVKRCADNQDGSFSYQDLQKYQTRSTYPLTAAGVTALFSGGEYDSVQARRGLDYLRTHQYELQWSKYHYFYGHYYACQAFYQAGGAVWEDYFSTLREEILSNQNPDGHWEDDVGPTYATAMGCLLLSVPMDYLPIFQR